MCHCNEDYFCEHCARELSEWYDSIDYDPVSKDGHDEHMVRLFEELEDEVA